MFGTVCLLLAFATADPQETTASPEVKAVEYLAREVAAWRPKNNCYSCHNNGDAARALYKAEQLKIEFDGGALAETTGWLKRPGEWENNGGEGPFKMAEGRGSRAESQKETRRKEKSGSGDSTLDSRPSVSDKKLADIQFAFAITAAMEAGRIRNSRPLLQAAARIAGYQGEEGCWEFDADQLIGSPATYGRLLATIVARKTLLRADRRRFQENIERAEKWLLGQQPKSVFAAAALLLFVGQAGGERENALRRQCLEVIRQGESSRGGWGPYITSRAEPFDSALVLLALAEQPENAGVAAMIERGREYLVAEQLADGSWIETTRPAGSTSYAQRLSTTGWATLALLATQPENK